MFVLVCLVRGKDKIQVVFPDFINASPKTAPEVFVKEYSNGFMFVG